MNRIQIVPLTPIACNKIHHNRETELAFEDDRHWVFK